MKILALDLSLSATGWVYLDDDEGFLGEETPHGVIKTRSRRKDEDEQEWYLARYHQFADGIFDILVTHPRADVLAVEVTKFGFKGLGTSVEFRAGMGLGRALGWLDGTLARIGYPGRVAYITSQEAKLVAAGNKTASKDAVKAYLEDTYGWPLDGWHDGAVDALAVATAHLRNLKEEARDLLRLDGGEATPSLPQPGSPVLRLSKGRKRPRSARSPAP